MLAEATEVRFAIYDVLGQDVSVLHEGPLAVGQHELASDVTGLPAGFYLVRVEGIGLSTIQRVTFLQ